MNPSETRDAVAPIVAAALLGLVALIACGFAMVGLVAWERPEVSGPVLPGLDRAVRDGALGCSALCGLMGWGAGAVPAILALRRGRRWVFAAFVLLAVLSVSGLGLAFALRGAE